MLKGILKKTWNDYVNSFDHQAVARVDCRPASVALVVGTFLIILTLLWYIPYINELIKLSNPVLPMILVVGAGVLSILSWWVYPKRNMVAFFQLVDVPLYGAAVVAAGALAEPPGSYIFIGLFGAGCFYWGVIYTVNWIRAATIAAGPLIVALILEAHVPTLILILAGVIMYVYSAMSQREKQKLIAHRDRSEDVIKRIDQLFSSSILGSEHLEQIPLRTLLHDIKNELSFATWNLELLSEDSVSSEDKKIWSDIKMGILHAVSTAQGYFDKEKSGSTASQIFWLSDLPAAFEDVPMLGDQKEKIHADPFPELSVRGSLDLLLAALRNLIENALEVGSNSVFVRTRVKDSGQTAVIEVADDGPGLPEPVQEKIFTPFNTHGKANGVGLGIYLSKRIVETMNGNLDLVSTGPGGTSFEIVLPVTESHETAFQSRSGGESVAGDRDKEQLE